MKTIMILSGKGGVGKTTVAANIAFKLSEKYKTGLLDVDIHGPNIPMILNIKKSKILMDENEKIIPMKYNENLEVLSLAFLSKTPEQAILWRGPLKHKLINQFLNDVKWDVEYLIVDFPPGTGDELLSFVQMIPDAKAIIVSMPAKLSLADAEKVIDACKRTNTSIIGLIENMSSDIFGRGTVKKLADKYSIPLLAQIDLTEELSKMSETENFSKNQSSKISEQFSKISEQIINAFN